MTTFAAGKYGNLTRNQLVKRLMILEGGLVDGVVGGEENINAADGSEELRTEFDINLEGECSADDKKSKDNTARKGLEVASTSKQSKEKKKLDFSKTVARKVALRVSYLGTNYYGFSSANPSAAVAAGTHHRNDRYYQPSSLASSRNPNGKGNSCADVIPTIEGELFRALMTCRLIPSPEECEWSKAGVSGFGQVVSLWVRTKLPDNHPSTLDWESIKSLKAERAAAEACMQADGGIVESNLTEPKEQEEQDEYPYLEMLNRLLPNEIRVLAWSPVPQAFDARFSCLWRQYKYFFPSANLDLEKMQQAAQLFIGSHDCRYICKIDPSKAGAPSFFMRDIYQSVIERTANPAFSVYIVKGRAFLWHQVRNMMALLFMVGQGLEDPNVISQILKPDVNMGKPNYEMAPDAPLVLLDCGYGEKLKWRLSDTTQKAKIASKNDGKTLQVVQELWTESSLRVLQLETLKEEYLALDTLQNVNQSLGSPLSSIVAPKNAAKHVSLLKRSRADSADQVKTKTAQKKRAKAAAKVE